MSEHAQDALAPRDPDALNYRSQEDRFDPAAEPYRTPAEAVFLGTEGRRPVDSHGDVLEDLESEQIEEVEIPD